MTKTPWTPGPWVISGRKSIRTKAPNGVLQGYIARANWNNGDANARLIAEAPAMAEALENLVRWFDDCGVVTTDRDDVPAARAILGRIKGETP